MQLNMAGTQDQTFHNKTQNFAIVAFCLSPCVVITSNGPGHFILSLKYQGKKHGQIFLN